MGWLTEGLSLVAGLLLGWFAHLLSMRRMKGERAVADATELWERCAEIANARVKFILAHHRKAPNAQELNEAHKDIKRRYRWADPEVILKGTVEWEAYHDAEVSARRDTSLPIKERIKAVEKASYVLFDAIGRRRTAARD